MTRRFILHNSRGDMIDLLADLDVFGVNPEGLGVQFDNTSHLASSNYLLEKSEVKQNVFKLSIAFGYVSHDAYQAYSKLLDLLNYPPYNLTYETSAGSWVRETRLSELTKTEIVGGDIMLEDFELECFTPWYKIVESKVDPTTDVPGDGKIYIQYDNAPLDPEKPSPTPPAPKPSPTNFPGTAVYSKDRDYVLGRDLVETEEIRPGGMSDYPIDYDYIYAQTKPKTTDRMAYYTYDYIYEGWINGQDGVFRINNESVYLGAQTGSPMEIIIEGPATNPYWQIVRDSQVEQSDGVNITIGEGYTLTVSSIPGQQRCILTAPDGTESNVYQQQRLDLTNFVMAPLGFSELIFFNARRVGFRMREEHVVV